MSLLSIDLAWMDEARIEQTRREWRALYKALCSDIHDGAKEILAGAPTLAPYQPHPKDKAALVTEFFPQRLEGTSWFDVLVRWSTDVDVSGNSLAVPAAITISSQIREVPTLIDVNGNPVVNTAGFFLLDPPPVKRFVDQTIRITKNIGLNLPDWVQTHPGTVNSDTCTIRGLPWPAGTLFCAGAGVGLEENLVGQDGTLSTLRSAPFTAAEIELWYRRDGWTEIYPSRGFMEILPLVKGKAQREIPGETKQQLRTRLRMHAKLPKFAFVPNRITIGPLGDYPQEPVFLDEFGRSIQPLTSLDQIVLLEYDFHEKQKFSGILPLK